MALKNMQYGDPVFLTFGVLTFESPSMMGQNSHKRPAGKFSSTLYCFFNDIMFST